MPDCQFSYESNCEFLKYMKSALLNSPYTSETFNVAILFSEDVFSYCRLS